MSDSAPSGAIWAQFRPKQLNQKGSPAHAGAHFSPWVGLYFTHRKGPIFRAKTDLLIYSVLSG